MKRGRKPSGRALTDAERQANCRARKAAASDARTGVWAVIQEALNAPGEHRELKRVAAKLESLYQGEISFVTRVSAQSGATSTGAALRSDDDLPPFARALRKYDGLKGRS